MLKAHQLDYMIPGIGVLIALTAAFYLQSTGLTYYFAIALTIAGLALWLAGKHTLGESWSSAFRIFIFGHL